MPLYTIEVSFNKLKDLVTYLYTLGPLTFLYPNQNLHQLYNNTIVLKLNESKNPRSLTTLCSR